MRKKTVCRVLSGLSGLLVILVASGSELVYTPVNPSFGGNPLGGQYLLNNAQAQDDFKDPNVTSRTQQSDLERFNDLLQRSILSRLSASLTGNVIDADGNLIPGTIETTDFVITIVDVGGGILEVTTTDKTTGESTSFQVSTQL
ncbi:curli assembly protein CsgF [Sedimenticola sp.]|uniref:curli assembly protein CsgF n=1 Tax=Sedimenticola sp. TaxID=1940285 RepID=UPI003D134D06